jgi:cellulose synthase/poly-beta-1,6-N-acetylglucosamine synthase-like glycosyltransferase
MPELGSIAFLASVAFILYTYLGYPLALQLIALIFGARRQVVEVPEEWPDISITVPMYNEERQAAALVESLLALDYPADKRQIVIVSDGSTDATDEIVGRYADRGVELVRQNERAGKTAAENAASARLRAGIVVNTDASIRIHPDALKRLIAPFADPSVGLTTGRDVSVGRAEREANLGESGYVGYEMWIRDLETRISGIVGASGSLYATRSHLHRIPVPDSLSRDFTAALKCREHGLRAVSVPDAVCIVPRTPSLRQEYRRKVRTMTRGMETLWSKRGLLNPFRHPIFAWKLFSHKVCRWAAPWAALLGFIGLGLLSSAHLWALVLALAAAFCVGLGAAGWWLGDGRPLPRLVQVPAFALMGNVAAMHAALRALARDRDPIWEPTRRDPVQTGN